MSKPWEQPMPEDQFARMRDILAAPSPIGLEAAMTHGVLWDQAAAFMPDSWAVHGFRGNAGLVFDTKPDDPDAFSVMVIGHADKIRLQVRSIGDDGKVWVEADSFLPST
ncbi:MAG: peptidase M42, partial [Planctomycetota bacterium]|nr:peptidase M42 [Planctomycetota bacterium]